MLTTQNVLRTDLFVSAKTSTAIPARNPLVRDALVQASLDPQVRAINFAPTANVGTTPIALGAIVIIRDDGRYYLDVEDARTARDPSMEKMISIALHGLGLAPLTLTIANIRSEPRFANAKTVWSYRMHPVGITMRMQILSVLDEEGPLPLSCLLGQIRAARDPTPAVLALACSDLIELDLITRALGPSTIARSRS